jgi:hypothetical protein
VSASIHQLQKKRAPQREHFVKLRRSPKYKMTAIQVTAAPAAIDSERVANATRSTPGKNKAKINA